MKKISGLHPFLIAVAPILFLLTHNLNQATPLEVVLPGLVSLIFTSLLLAGLWLIRRDYTRCALTTSVIWVAFYSYGRIFDFLWSMRVSHSMASLHWLVGTASAALIGCSVMYIWRTRQDLRGFGGYLTITSAILVLLFLGQIAFHSKVLRREYRERKKWHLASGTEQWQRKEPILQEDRTLPDIYYIILDGYARSDVLQEFYGHDNSDFIRFLKRRGFYVAEKSCSNYPMTHTSLASSLNMEYLDSLFSERELDSWGTYPTYKYIRNHRAGQFLRSKGYRYVHFNTNYGITESSDIADITCSFRPAFLMGEFSGVLLRSTMLRGLEPDVAEAHLYTFKRLMEIPDIRGPTFAFAHILMPHNPYVFDRDGNVRHNIPIGLQMKEKTGGWQAKAEYIDQLIFLNRKMEEVIDSILKNSVFPPIIIIQADHGSGTTMKLAEANTDPKSKVWADYLRERFRILNAYYAPEEITRDLYPNVSPVNAFRLVFNACFRTNFEILPDRCYYAGYDDHFAKLRDVTELTVAEPTVELGKPLSRPLIRAEQ